MNAYWHIGNNFDKEENQDHTINEGHTIIYVIHLKIRLKSNLSGNFNIKFFFISF